DEHVPAVEPVAHHADVVGGGRPTGRGLAVAGHDGERGRGRRDQVGLVRVDRVRGGRAVAPRLAERGGDAPRGGRARARARRGVAVSNAFTVYACAPAGTPASMNVVTSGPVAPICAPSRKIS